MFLGVMECQHVLFQEILKAPYSNQAVNGVYMYHNKQCENETKGKELIYRQNSCISCLDCCSYLDLLVRAFVCPSLFVTLTWHFVISCHVISSHMVVRQDTAQIVSVQFFAILLLVFSFSQPFSYSSLCLPFIVVFTVEQVHLVCIFVWRDMERIKRAFTQSNESNTGAVLVYQYTGEFLLFSYPYMEL